MKVKKIDHIGIAVKSIQEASKLYTDLFSLEGKEESLADRKLKIMMIKIGDVRIELLEDQDPEGAISRFIEKRGEGLNHIAFEVDDIYGIVERLKVKGYRITAEPSPGADNTIVTFVHPKDANGVMIELVERRKN